MRKKIHIVIIEALLISNAFFLGCATGKSSQQRILTAYMETGYLKYYIRPDKMISKEYKNDSAAVMIDFSYQKKNREYVSDAYVNFTLHYETDKYIENAHFLIADGEIIPLLNIKTLDRHVADKYIRVSTILEKKYVGKILESLKTYQGTLEIKLEGGEKKVFIVTDSLAARIEEAFKN